MKLLFITLGDIRNIDSHDIYSDLMRSLAKDGHEVFIVSPVERRNKKPTFLIENVNSSDWHKNVHILKIKTGNIQKTNFIEKGISTILIEGQIKKGIKKYFKSEHFDLILYSTPPITIYKPIKYLKKKCGCKTYLMLKDIFPQNAVDLGMLSKSGLKAPLYKAFRKKEIKLYEISDRIGCMSKANIDFVIKNNKEIDPSRVEIFPNCIDIQEFKMSNDEVKSFRKKYELPLDKKIYVYGGNLGRPQDISFIIECLKKKADDNDIFFLVAGDGTEFSKLEEYQKSSSQNNFKLIKRLPKDDFDKMIYACDVGLIFLDHRFTIPNFPSRFLSYLQAKLPVLACTDSNTDIGEIITTNNLGWWSCSDSVEGFEKIIDESKKADLKKIGDNGFKFLKANYDVKKWDKHLLNGIGDKNGRI